MSLKLYLRRGEAGECKAGLAQGERQRNTECWPTYHCAFITRAGSSRPGQNNVIKVPSLTEKVVPPFTLKSSTKSIGYVKLIHILLV